MTGGSLGALLRTWHLLDAHDDVTRRAIRDLLAPGLEWRSMNEPPPRPVPAPLKEPQRVESGPAPLDARAPPTVGGADAAPEVVRFTARRGRPRTIELPPDLPTLAPDAATPPIEEPLLEPSWARSVLSAALACRVPAGEVDLPALTRALVTLSSLRSLPRKPHWTLRTGAQVLVDRRPAMMAYFAEQSSVARQVEAVVGRERTTVLRCDTFPPKQVSGLKEVKWRKYQLPAPGVAVLLISDLGLSRGALPDQSELEPFLRTLSSQKSAVIMLTPGPPLRYPEALRREVCLLEWDLGTRPSDAARLRRLCP
jgi:hypothetical protein